MLTAKQEKFVHGIVSGMSQADAYRSAYNCERMSDNAIYVNASKLVANANIAIRISELRDKAAEPSIMTAKERMAWLTDVIKSEDQVMSDRLKASDQLNRMQGEYVQKVEADVKSEYTINIDLVDDDAD